MTRAYGIGYDQFGSNLAARIASEDVGFFLRLLMLSREDEAPKREAEAREAFARLSNHFVDTANAGAAEASEPLTFGYTNWRGEFAERTAIPLRVERKESEWHGPGLHWVLVALDLEKQAERDFLIKDIGRARTFLESIPAAGGAVKTLDWGSNGFVSTAIGAYRVTEFPSHPGDVLTVRVTGLLGGESGTWFNNINEAKAAAQADFERRVLSCFSTGAVEEADATAEAIVDEVALKSERRDVPDPHLRRLSTPTANAEAGPADEADQRLDSENAKEWPAAHAYLVGDDCEQINWGGDVKYPHDPGLVLLYAHPVEALAEIERLTRERDKLRKLDFEYGQVETAIIMRDRHFDGDSKHANCGERLIASVNSLADRAETAEAALVEEPGEITELIENLRTLAALLSADVWQSKTARKAAFVIERGNAGAKAARVALQAERDQMAADRALLDALKEEGQAR